MTLGHQLSINRTHNSPIPASWIALSCAITLICGVSGCGGTTAPDTKLVYSVTGSLIINGKPAADALVTLHPDGIDDVPAPSARVAADGSFTMNVMGEDMKNFDTPGDPAGEYKVLVYMPRDPAVMLSPDRLAGVYTKPENSTQTVTIHLGENKLEPIRMDNIKLAK